jgi:hypothetical protein
MGRAQKGSCCAWLGFTQPGEKDAVELCSQKKCRRLSFLHTLVRLGGETNRLQYPG